ncbi:MAG: Uma2 family endonuclease [Deltaproteobacteria bacterium]|nr:Uma2 family endonuclease [Deltaproteobacteria bacterium]
MSLEEWAALPEDEPGEIVDGFLVEDEVSDPVHDVIAAWLVASLRAWVRPRGGLVGVSDTKFAVSARRGRKPDTWVYFSREKLPPRHGLVRVPPDLLAEVVSPRPRDQRRDRVEKLAEYAAFGVRYYWIVDPQLRTLEVLELGADGRYVHALAGSTGRIESVPGCPGLALDLDELWAEVDAFGPPEPDAEG